MAKKPVKKAAPKKAAPKKIVKAKAAAPKAAAAASKTTVQKVQVASRPKNSSTNSYTYSEFVENVKNYCGIEKRAQAKTLVDDLATFIRDSLKKGYKLPLLGLGKLYVRESKARMARNPQTGQEIRIPARKRVRFTPAKALKEHVLK
jgi:DNA-binding protein HU-beta